MSEKENPFVEYFGHYGFIVGGLSLFCGFLFTSITILLMALQNKRGKLAKARAIFSAYNVCITFAR
jgi:hypothetical protein